MVVVGEEPKKEYAEEITVVSHCERSIESVVMSYVNRGSFGKFCEFDSNFVFFTTVPCQLDGIPEVHTGAAPQWLPSLGCQLPRTIF